VIEDFAEELRSILKLAFEQSEIAPGEFGPELEIIYRPDRPNR